MKVGDLVNIAQDRGTGSFKRTDHLGLGVVLQVHEEAGTMTRLFNGAVSLGDSFTVRMLSGETRQFCEESLEVVSEHR